MSFDNSRYTFDHWKDYSGVVMEQGRVQTDADWNEWLSELSRRIRAGTLDTLGHAVYPATTPYAFEVQSSVSGGKNVINIGLGRMYVDGILVENHGDPANATWDTALEELSNTPQPPPETLVPLDSTNSISYEKQPFGPGLAAPTGTGDWLAYLDVWRRPITYIEDPSLIDPAIGVDTTGRLQTAWQVQLMALPNATIAGSVTSGTFTASEQIVQTNTGASAKLQNVPSGSSGMIVGLITGTADATHTWTGQTSGAVFTPTTAPLGDYSTIAGAVTSGTFVVGEQVKQSNSGATANVITTVAATGPILVDEIIGGTANATNTWVGQASGAVFTPSAAPVPTTWTCSTPDADIPWPRTAGRLSNGTVSGGSSGPCCLTSGTGYTGAENQLYRVEIHRGGTDGGADATFTWSRENASVQTNVMNIATGSNTLGDPASVLTVQSLGRDQVLGFTAGNWIEVTNETMDDFTLAGELYQIDKVDPASMTITLTTLLSSSFPASSLTQNGYTRIIRRDQSGKVYRADNSVYYDLDAVSGGVVNGSNGIPIPADGSHLILENGIVIWFGLTVPNGRYHQMDFWTFSARAATGNIDPLTDAPPRGIHHHFTKLAILSLGSGTSGQDCRTPWAPSNCDCGSGCCTVTVGDGTTSHGMYTSIQQAVNALPGTGGEVCILPGSYYEYVLLQDLSDVVLQGCEYQSQVFSPLLGPGTNMGTSQSSATASGLTAVFTIVNCQNLDMRWLSIAAGTDEIGILIDRASPKLAEAQHQAAGDSTKNLYRRLLSSNINLENLAVLSSTFPNLLARAIVELTVDENSFTMQDVAGKYPVVSIEGEDLFFERNTVEVANKYLFRQAQNTNLNQAPTQNLEDLSSLTAAQWASMSPGGVQIAGPSRNVFLTENTIEGGSGNGITLGNLLLLDANGNDTGTIAAVNPQSGNDCSPGGGGTIPSGPSSGSGGGTFVAGGVIRNVHIDRNIIRNMGMSGIGPVGFFDLSTTPEIISVINISIRSNIIARTLLRPIDAASANQASVGYGAITMPDVQNLTVRDNSIIDFGQAPGAYVSGVYVLHGEGIEISRNQIRETRDLSGVALSTDTVTSQRAGILIHLVSPPTFDITDTSSSSTSPSSLDTSQSGLTAYEAPVYTPGLPALRIQENVVRVADGMALYARGTGPFSIVNNHLSSGTPAVSGNYRTFEAADLQTGASTGNFGSFNPALLVYILNLGIAVELEDIFNTFSGVYNKAFSSSSFASAGISTSTTNGTVLFTNNICQLEARAKRLRGLTSVLILTLDNLLFSNNQTWLDGLVLTSYLDAFLFGVTLEVTSNRFQESLFIPVLFSAFSFGFANITTNNIATFCIEAAGLSKITTPNIVLIPDLCPGQKEGFSQDAAAAMKGSDA